jgi:hypothetical protein
MSSKILDPLFVTDDTPRARRRDRDTSHEAADSNRNRLAVEASVFALIKSYPMTDDELTTAYFLQHDHEPAHIDSPRKRRSDLAKKGLLVATPIKRKTHTKRYATVWAVK